MKRFIRSLVKVLVPILVPLIIEQLEEAIKLDIDGDGTIGTDDIITGTE